MSYLKLDTEAFFAGQRRVMPPLAICKRTGSLILKSNEKTCRNRIVPALFVVLLISLLSLLFAITSALASPSDDADISELEHQSAELNNSYNQALQEMVALDTETQRQEQEIKAVRERSSEVTTAIADQEGRLVELQQQLMDRQVVLEKRLTSSYKSSDMGYIEVVMGAGDFSDFLNRVDMVNKIAEEDQRLIDSYKETKKSIEDELASLAEKQAELTSLEASLSSAEQELLTAQSEKQAFVSSLENQMATNTGQLEQLRTEAAQIEASMSSIQSQVTFATSGGGDSSPSGGGASISVTATAYCLSGRTATGMPAGPGIIAVDPGVIPLGSQVYVSGYGNAIAADTGGAISGNKIDVWLPCGDAYSWGVRTVNVTIY